MKKRNIVIKSMKELLQSPAFIGSLALDASKAAAKVITSLLKELI
ncbi:TPA: hypothetical protein ACPVZG_005277 [Vibrio parahaemolyticus]